jgi:hypothetical protein
MARQSVENSTGNGLLRGGGQPRTPHPAEALMDTIRTPLVSASTSETEPEIRISWISVREGLQMLLAHTSGRFLPGPGGLVGIRL